MTLRFLDLENWKNEAAIKMEKTVGEVDLKDRIAKIIFNSNILIRHICDIK